MTKEEKIHFWTEVVPNLPGNSEQYDVSTVEQVESPLKGKTILFLGSSVTVGAASLNQSFADFMGKKDNFTAIKEAVSGTTLVTQNETSYIPRMKTMDTGLKADLFVCQLSTNDATKNKPFGEVGQESRLEEFDETTIAGAIQYIIVYARETWHCPVMFYTGTRFDSENYDRMVELLKQIQQKWQIGIIDLWNNEKLNAISDENKALYILPDGIHPTKAGYLLWWMPEMEKQILQYLNLA